MNKLFKLAVAMGAVLTILFTAPTSPDFAGIVFLACMAVLIFGMVKDYRRLFPRGVNARQAWQSDQFGGFIFQKGLTIVGLTVLFCIVALAGSAQKNRDVRQMARFAEGHNERAETLSTCEWIENDPTALSDMTKERRAAYIAERCQDYAKDGDRWREMVAEATLNCIGWKAGMKSDDFAWCEYYDRTPKKPTAEQIAAYQQAHYDDVFCGIWKDSHPIRRLIELRHLRWCGSYQPQQIDTQAQTASTTAEPAAAKPATGDDLWK